MKNTILYYYNLTSDSIHNINDAYYFRSQGFLYELYNCKNYIDNISNIYDISNKLIQFGFPCHEIILNINNSILTKINDKDYVLMKIFVDDNNVITLKDLELFNRNIKKFDNLFNSSIKWDKLWETKIDYYEYEINQLGKKYPSLRSSFSYYNGLAENANILFKNIKNNVNFNSISHRRIGSKYSVKELYNPFNLIIDSRVRNISEYFKERFFYNNNIIEEINYFLQNCDYNNEEYELFFIRMMFPSFYFDVFQDIISGLKDEFFLDKIIHNCENYENMLIEIYLLIRKISTIPEIEWLTKKI